MSKAYVLLSGGVDSTTCLAIAMEQFDRSVEAISVDYGQRHVKETHLAQEIAAFYKIPHSIVKIPTIGVGGLTNPDQVIPQVDYADLPEGMSPSFVPFRNGLLLSTIASLAVADPEGEAVFFGAHAEDAQNWAYPDCTPEFIGAMASAIYVGTYHKVRLHAPLTWLNKAQVVEWGTKLHVPYGMTWSCYEGGAVHCGVCPTCRARRTAFAEADVRDPTVYAMAVGGA